MSKPITILADGSWDPPGGVEINPGGEVKFVLSDDIPAGSGAIITFVSPIEIVAPDPDNTGGGTIKVGS
jgi:hypothetical protein